MQSNALQLGSVYTKCTGLHGLKYSLCNREVVTPPVRAISRALTFGTVTQIYHR